MIRLLTYSFCAFAFLFSIVSRFNFFPKILVYVCGIPLSLAIGYFVKMELQEFFSDFEWKPKNNFERIQNLFFIMIGSGVFYYFLLLSIMVLFIPWFESYKLGNVKLYHLIFISISFVFSLPKALRK